MFIAQTVGLSPRVTQQQSYWMTFYSTRVKRKANPPVPLHHQFMNGLEKKRNSDKKKKKTWIKHDKEDYRIIKCRM